MIKFVEIPKESVTDICAKYCIEERCEIYFLAYETEPTKPISVLWSDLKFLRRNFGVDMMKDNSFNDKADVTEESLNFGRKLTIAKFKKAIELGIWEFEIDEMLPDGTFRMVRNPNYGKVNNESGLVDFRKEIEYSPTKANKGKLAYYQSDIDKGLYVLCKYV